MPFNSLSRDHVIDVQGVRGDGSYSFNSLSRDHG